jgi:hypothetical protein
VAVIAYIQNVFAGASHLLNAITGGPAKHSFSAWSGFKASRGVEWRRIVCVIVNALLFSRNHCLEQAREEGLI